MTRNTDVHVPRRAAAAALAAAACGLTGAPAASAAPPAATPLTPAVVAQDARWFAGTDGARSIVYTDLHGNGRLLREDARGRVAARRLPAGCLPGELGRWSVRLTCGPAGAAEQRLMSLADGATRPVVGAQPDDLLGVPGRHWIRGNTTRGGAPQHVFVNVATGERRTVPFGEDPAAYDLDSPALTVRPAPPRGVTVAPGRPLTSGSRIAVRHGGRTLVLRDRCQCSSASISSGVVAWSEDGEVMAYRLRDRRWFTWQVDAALQRRLPAPGYGATASVGAAHVGQTARRLVWAYNLREQHADGTPKTLILSARLPAVRQRTR